jgi:hypothetical protein
LPLAAIAISPELVAMLTNDPGGAADFQSNYRRMSVRPPMHSRPVRNRETITSLIVVAAMLLSADRGGAAFTLEQLLTKMRELLRPGQILAADDVRSLLPGLEHCLVPALGRWRWKRRESVYQG